MTRPGYPTNAKCGFYLCMHCKKANNDTSPAITDNATEFSAAKYIIVFIFWLYCIVFFSMSVVLWVRHFHLMLEDSQFAGCPKVSIRVGTYLS